MPEPTILWYAHDRGIGHLSRARCVIPHLTSPVVVAHGPAVGTDAMSFACPVVVLPSDVPDQPEPTTGPWHHAPVSAQVRERTLALVAAIDRFNCQTVVADVSMEVVALGRLAGLRVVAVRQSGHRDDIAHAIGFASADAVWVPQHRDLEPNIDDADERWHFTGAFSRYDTAFGAARVRPHDRPAGTRSVLIVIGGGGSSFDAVRWRGASLPNGWHATIVGLREQWECAHSVSFGFVSELREQLAGTDLLITSGGWASVAESAAVGAPMAIVPEQRPFDEQCVRARALERAGLAAILDGWPHPSELDQVAARVARTDPNGWPRFYDGCGAQRAAAMIESIHRR